LDAQVDVLSVSVGQLRASVAGGNSALKQGHLVGIKSAFFATTLVKELCKAKLEPCVSAKVDIVANVCGVLEDLRSMTVMRLYDIDASKSIVSGTGLVSCLRGLGAVNEVKVACVNSAGKPADWVTAEDVVVIARSVDGEVVGRGVGGQVVGKGKIVIKYEVDDVDMDEIDLSVTVGGVIVSGPQRVAVCSAIKTDAAHVRTIIPIKGTGNYGIAVTLDGLHLIVSDYRSHSISVYSMDSGGCISSFGCFGSKPGQFKYPFRICATPRGTILVSECGNGRLQEVTITGEHVRFIGEARHFDYESVYGLCMQGDLVAVGKHGSSTDGRIVLFSYSSGALIRKFGSYGFGEDQMANVFGLSFTPDEKHILIANRTSLLSMFSVDGAYVKTFGTRADSGGWNDVLCSGSSIFMTDSRNDRVCVFSAETGALIRTWGMQGLGDGQFMFPSTLANHKNKLFVLDTGSPRVQVFE
jgi:DNA-binding beta-propeller fold protein YncE